MKALRKIRSDLLLKLLFAPPEVIINPLFELKAGCKRVNHFL